MKTPFNKLLKGSLIIIVISIIPFSMEKLSGQVTLSEGKWILSTYKVNPPDKNPIFFKGEAYQGASRYVYPLALLDNLSNEKSDHAWKALKLANEYIELCIMPEIGGKLWYGTDKTNGYNFIYKNNVVRQLLKYWKSLDNRRVYTSAAGWPVIPENDYNPIPAPRIQQWGQGLKSIINREAPQTMFDFRDIISKYSVPTVGHEIGQWCVYPDFKEIEKYTGVLKTTNFEIFR